MLANLLVNNIWAKMLSGGEYLDDIIIIDAPSDLVILLITPNILPNYLELGLGWLLYGLITSISIHIISKYYSLLITIDKLLPYFLHDPGTTIYYSSILQPSQHSFIIYRNKTMSHTTENICANALSHLFDRFIQQLKINQLLKRLPDYLAHTLCEASLQTLFLGAIPLPKNDSIGAQDAGATNIALDINSTFSINCEQTIPKPANDSNIQVQPKGIFNRAKSKRRQNSITKPKPEQKSELFALSEPIVNPKQIELEDELQLVKKNLYFMRRLRKEYEQEQKRRLEQILNRKNLQLPATEFAFDFSGEFLQKSKPNFKKHLAIPTTAKSEDVTQPNTHEKVIDTNTNYSDRDFLISRGLNASPSREGKRLLFANHGNRQISHLPFIKLNDNIKLSQGPRSFKGADSQRYTLKSYQSRGDSNFRSFSEIEKERSDRLYSLKRSSRETEYVQDQIEQKQVSFVTPKKQSKRMQKYLKKLCEDRYKNNVDEINRSCNFDRINSPHDYSVHRFYKHNFDQDKRSICELSLASIKLQSSHFFQESTQLE